MIPELNKIYQGDCLKIMKGWPADFVDMIWTDPPYGHANQDGDLASSRVGVKGARQRPAVVIANDTAEETGLLLDGIMEQAARVLKPDCCLCCCVMGGGGVNPTFAHHTLMMSRHLDFFNAVIWDKSARGNGLGWRYRRNYEFVMVAHRKGGKLLWNDENAAVPNIIRTPPVPNDDHPTQKPIDLVANFIKWHTKPGDLIVDPCCGSGTTLVAAEKMGRRWIGIELDPRWARVAQDRIDAERSQGRLF